MGWWRFWDKDEETDTARRTGADPRLPPGRHPVVPRQDTTSGDAARDRRVAELRRRRDAILFDIEQGESALRPENPWHDRIDLLGEALETIDADREALDNVSHDPAALLPSIPITGIRARSGDQIDIEFSIGGEQFSFSEEIDWDQRGGAVVRGDLRWRTGDADALVPANLRPDHRAALAEHLADSIAVFATDLRDRILAGDALPAAPTLVDLAQPCPECGGWADWHGRCPACTARELRRQALRLETERLDAERTKEAEDRHRLAEALPVARRRLMAIETDLAALGA